MQLPLQGAAQCVVTNKPRVSLRLPWAMCICPFRACRAPVTVGSVRRGNHSRCSALAIPYNMWIRQGRRIS